jgi:hypothetical protein
MLRTTMETMKRALCLAALTLGAWAALLPPAATRAQGLPAPGDGFTWERVGDTFLQPSDLTFGPDSTLWASSSDGPYRLDLSGGFPGVWMLVNDRRPLDTILPLGRGSDGDTLLGGRAYTYRSTDGGRTWAQVHDRGGDALYEVPPGYPYAGRILTSGSSALPDAVAYSDDRGATFADGHMPGSAGAYADARDFVALPPGSLHPGRILAAGRWGVNISDDGGATFRESALWQAVYYIGEAIAAVGPATGGTGRAVLGEGKEAVVGVMGGRVSAQADARAWSSADGGETWGPGEGQHLVEGTPNDGGVVAVLPVGALGVLAVLGGGTVYRSDDAGETWTAVGRAPEISALIYAKAATVGPDGRLYVGLREIGAFGEGWVWRTAEVLTASVNVRALPVNSPVVIGPDGGSFPFAVQLTNTTTLPISFQAWSEAAGPLTVSPVLGPRAVTLPPGTSVTRTLTQRVPAGAPPGTYTYTVAVGDFPGTVISSDSFTVVKQGTSGGRDAGVAEGWTVSGWATAAGPAEAVRLAVAPNPFSEEAAVTLTLPEPGEVAVALYDVLGRRVALLHEGALEAGEHALRLDGRSLPAGVYVVRAAAGGVVVTRTATLLR